MLNFFFITIFNSFVEFWDNVEFSAFDVDNWPLSVTFSHQKFTSKASRSVKIRVMVKGATER